MLHKGTIVLKNHFEFECYDQYGNLKWKDGFDNLVPNVGLDDALDKHLKGSGYTAAWYVGLTDSSPSPNANDTMSSHGGWTEADDYDESAREDLTLGAVSGQSVDNSASKASFTINASVTIGGAFVCSDSTKNGTSGILYGVGAFTGGNRACEDNDVLNVTVTCTAAAS